MLQLSHFRPIAQPAMAASLSPITPAEYLRLRRVSMGLNIAQLAARIAPLLPADVNPFQLVHSLEAPRARARSRRTIKLLARVLPIDVDIYFQLANAGCAPPTLCHHCGCGIETPCLSADGHERCTITNGECSRCASPDRATH